MGNIYCSKYKYKKIHIINLNIFLSEVNIKNAGDKEFIDGEL